MNVEKKIVINTRYSSDMQSPKSCADQEREVRAALSKMGIDHSNAIVIYDEAESATKTYRDEYVRLEAMVRAGEIGILAVDDQARLSRADNAFAFIIDVVYFGGRFISTGEGIDTEQTGWKLRVKVMELHNSTTIRELGRRVRRGQLGRVLSQRSAGDFPYGYRSFPVDPDAVRDGRGPKPERGVKIHEEEAVWVRKIFDWFNASRSIAWIARELTRLKAPKGHRRRSHRWRARHARGILDNEKYVGNWCWGRTRTIRNSQGKKKQIDVPKEQQVVVQRPELRIVDADAWDQAQDRLRKLNDIYGRKSGQKERGPKVHHTELYPGSLLGGLVFCSQCGARMWQIKVRSAIEEAAHRVPKQMKLDERRLRELRTQIENLVNAVAGGAIASQALQIRLAEAEREKEQVRQRVKDARRMLDAPVSMPDDEWVQRKLADLSAVLREDEHKKTSLLLRRLIRQVMAEAVIAPGKVRGCSRLRFRIDGTEVVRSLLEASNTATVSDHLLPASADARAMSNEVVLDLGGPTKMDQWAPQIAEMREQGVPWKEIWKVTGLGSGPAYVAWKRFVDAQQAADGDVDVNVGEHESDDDAQESLDDTEAE